MDPLLPPPPAVTPITTSATNSAPTPPSLNHNHPPYAQMICEAITALKERDGSSKRAIAKFIEKSYANLPPTHSALLTHHLKRLKNAGLVVLVKKSYKLLPLSGSDAPSPATTILQSNGLQINNNSTAAAAAVTVHSTRGRGRPSKPDTGPGNPKRGRGRGRPRKTDGPVQQRGPVKRRAGRPRKPKTVKGRQVLQQQAQAQAQAQDQLNNVTVTYVTSGANVPVPVLSGVRRRGRPRKVGPAVDAGGPRRGRGPRPGRPKKNLSALTQAAEAQAQSIADLKSKFEFFQSRVMQVVAVLKPQITSESQISAVAAIQELEGLASMDINIPLKEDTQPPALQSK